MNSRDIASLAYRLAGIVSIIQAIQLVPSLATIPALRSQSLENDSSLLVLFVGCLVPIVFLALLGLLLIVKSRALADATVREKGVQLTTVEPFHVHTILFSVLGVLALVLASSRIPALIHNVALILAEFGTGHGYQERQMELVRGTWVRSAGVALQLGLGVGLLIWAKRLARVYHPREAPAHRRSTGVECPHCGHPFSAADYREGADECRCSKCRGRIPDDLLRRRPG